MRSQHPPKITPELVRIRHESWAYTCDRPNRLPPADSPNRPALARLWWAAHQARQRRPNMRTFKHHGTRFAVVYVGQRLGVLDIASCRVLVLSPTSLAALLAMLN